jgi:hypothetical protein
VPEAAAARAAGGAVGESARSGGARRANADARCKSTNPTIYTLVFSISHHNEREREGEMYTSSSLCHRSASARQCNIRRRAACGPRSSTSSRAIPYNTNAIDNNFRKRKINQCVDAYRDMIRLLSLVQYDQPIIIIQFNNNNDNNSDVVTSRNARRAAPVLPNVACVRAYNTHNQQQSTTIINNQ